MITPSSQSLMCWSFHSLYDPLNRSTFISFMQQWYGYQRCYVDDVNLHFHGRAALDALLERRYVGAVIIDVERDVIVGHCIGFLAACTDQDVAFIELSRHVDQAAYDKISWESIQQQLTEVCNHAITNRIYADTTDDTIPQVREWHSFFPLPHQLVV